MAVAVAAILVAGLTAVLVTQNAADAACRNASPANHVITIQNGKASSTDLHAKLCDTLTYKNLDKVTREIAFGPHEHHVPYDGMAEKFLNQNQVFTITLNMAGTYHWHDHLHDEIEGYFTVSK